MEYNTSNINSRIGKFVRQNRASIGMSSKSLAAKLNISQQHISRFELGQCAFTLEFILRLLNVFEKSLCDLIYEVFYEDVRFFCENQCILDEKYM
ncbi:helix-turn-helix domain-containing protein (plasmid) [Yersinia sp. HM-2024]|uniref:helix-turn-helix domain-containing protein n=1 Tax=Yersinia sp. HM-2024 TaxID=3344550 RepID=UPI00370D6457